MLAATPVAAQTRVAIPTMLPDATSFNGGQVVSGGVSVAPGYTSPAYSGTPLYTTNPAFTTGPVYATPSPYSVQQPVAAIGTPQPALAQYDPYAMPGAAPAAPAYAPPPGYAPMSPPVVGAPYQAPPTFANGFVPTAIRLLQEVRLEETYLARLNNSTGFGVNDIETRASFGFPFLRNPAPLLVTPGFNLHLWDGPNTTPTPGVDQDVPGRTYDAYLATSWRPQFSQTFAADLAVSVGVYSDFSYVDSNSLRVLGRGLGLVTLSPQWQLALGVVYLNRLSVKLLPAGGLIWTPNPDARFEIVFPNPKLAQRLTTIGNTDLWGYVAGEYGGDQWTIKHADGTHDVMNYNDIRLLMGIEWFGLSRVRGNAEIGYIFDRQILYLNNPTFNPSDTILLRAGFAF